ncbi:MAG TPA: 4-alpha-glucanotransferase [Thermoanaerobaculia bacterium]|nr:4-alpha-glucanotransferase [Thermoanaerobaculia bacterium]
MKGSEVLSRRRAGILLHPTSLPGGFGIGDFGREGVDFLDWLASAGQTIWQVLPLHPAPHASPYGASSAFAGNPLLISPRRLLEEGLLSESALAGVPEFPSGRVDYHAVRVWKEGVLRRSWQESRSEPRLLADLETFRRAPEQKSWLADWALFAAISENRSGDWTSWPEDLRRRRRDALEKARHSLEERVAFHEYVQFLFFRQWDRVRSVARGRAVAILGDLPIYVTHDSADAWSRQELFRFDEDGKPEAVAGVPPDAYSETGQLWGYPLYRWDEMERGGFSWWIERLRHALRLADAVRIDHFRGFAAGWNVPAGAKTAMEGEWIPGPGIRLFEAARTALGEVPLIAEDLGVITEDVRELLAAVGAPGMKVLQFAFSADDSEHLPHRHIPNAVVYTGTHDNDTTRGWFDALPEEERRRVLDYVGGDGASIEWGFVRAAYESVARTAIVPLQDVFGLGSETRMNTPAVAEGNWSWRAAASDFTRERAGRLRRLAALTGR